MYCCLCAGACSHTGPHSYCPTHDPNRIQVCPHCGYCPHCGRGGYYSIPYYPQPYAPITIGVIKGTTTSSSLDNQSITYT